MVPYDTVWRDAWLEATLDMYRNAGTDAPLEYSTMWMNQTSVFMLAMRKYPPSDPATCKAEQPHSRLTDEPFNMEMHTLRHVEINIRLEEGFPGSEQSWKSFFRIV